MTVQVSLEQLLERNKALRNTHVGERCFILGNGPSLKQVDLSLLADEFVFTVNNFSFVDGFEKARTNVHLWMDRAFFDLRTDLKFNMPKILDNYRRMATQNPLCFVDVAGFNFIKRHRLDEILNINYLHCGANDIAANDQPLFIDIGARITGFYTVVQYAIVAAIYMGFKEIYLLGCDSTGILSTINAALDIEIKNDHAYQDEDQEDSQKQLIRNLGMTYLFFSNYKLFVGYDKLNYACWKLLNIKLINCSAQTIITSIPRMHLADVLKRGGSE